MVVTQTQLSFDAFGGLFQDFITALMPVNIVDLLEVINVEIHAGDAIVLASCNAPFLKYALLYHDDDC